MCPFAKKNIWLTNTSFEQTIARSCCYLGPGMHLVSHWDLNPPCQPSRRFAVGKAKKNSWVDESDRGSKQQSQERWSGQVFFPICCSLWKDLDFADKNGRWKMTGLLFNRTLSPIGLFRNLHFSLTRKLNHSTVAIGAIMPRLMPFFGLKGFWGQPQGPNFPFPWATMLALRLDCSTAALTISQKVLSIRRLVELKMLDFSDRTRTGISILTLAADLAYCFSIEKNRWRGNTLRLIRVVILIGTVDLIGTKHFRIFV